MTKFRAVYTVTFLSYYHHSVARASSPLLTFTSMSTLQCEISEIFSQTVGNF